MAVGDVASHDVVADAATVLEAQVGLHGVTVGVGHEVARIGLLAAHDPLGVLVAHHQPVVAVGHHLRGDGLHLLVDAVDGSADGGILAGDVRALDELGDEAPVGGDDEFADVGKLGARLGDGDLAAVEVLHLHALDDLMRVAVEHDVDATGVVDEAVGTEAHRLGRLADVGEQHHIVGSCLAGVVDSLLDELVERLRLQVVEQDAVGVVERVALEDHRLWGDGSDVGHLLVAILADDVGGVDGLWLSCLVEVGTDHGGASLLEQGAHTGHAVVELVVAKRQRVVVHQSQDVGDVLSFGDGARGVALQEVATADGSGVGRVRLVDGVAQPCYLRIAVDAAVGVVLIEDYDALGLLLRLQARRCTTA